MNKKVIVASKNPVKIKAVEKGFQKMYPSQQFTFEGIAVPSGVSDQPMTNAETLIGAINRSSNAQKELREADYWVGVEGGIDVQEEDMEVFAWVVIKDKVKLGKARTATFYLPQKVTDLIKQGYELGVADDMIFGQSNSKQKSGSVGILTGNVIDRTDYYIDAVVLALIPFRNEALY